MKAVILAGGLGTRMGDCCNNIPKPMLPVAGKPVLEHQLEALKKEGVTEFIFVTGYLGEKIQEYFQDGRRFGVSVSYFHEEEPLGTAGALSELGLKEDFLLCNGDLIFSFSLEAMADFHKKNNALATLLTHPNSHPYDSTLVCADANNCVTDFLKPDGGSRDAQNLCNAGIQIISPKLLAGCKGKGNKNLDRDVILPALETGRVYSYKSFEYVKDMGTPERLEAVERDINEGIVEALHRNKKQKAVFVDRDGTVNVHKGYITDPDDLELITDAAKAIVGFKSKGYHVIIVTNQPVVARGDCDESRLRKIHNRLEALLGEEGAYVDAIYYCPHHPDKGFENEVEELKITCDCRKPSPGLLLRAMKDFNLDMSQSFMAGDSVRDVQAGINAGCTPVFLAQQAGDTPEGVKSYKSLYRFYKAMSQ